LAGAIDWLSSGAHPRRWRCRWSRQDIADFLGLTIETVSRTFTKLERNRVIEILPGSISLLDPARAEALAAA